MILKENDLVKIDLGVHIDGYIAVVAHTVYLAASLTASLPHIGRLADVFNAAYQAAEIAVRLIRPGNTNQQVTDAIAKVASTYGVQAIAGTVMHQMKRYVIEGNKIIHVRDGSETGTEKKLEIITFEPYEVYAIDVAFSTGEGKSKDRGLKTSIFKRVIDRKYGLKVKSSRQLYSEINAKFPTFPFSLRYLQLEEKNVKLGLRECVHHELLAPYPILSEKEGDLIAHFKFTALVLPSGIYTRKLAI